MSFALHESSIEITMYQKLCHVAMKLAKAVEGNAKSETQVMKSPFGKKSDSEINVSLVEQTIPMIVLFGTIGLVIETLG